MSSKGLVSKSRVNPRQIYDGKSITLATACHWARAVVDVPFPITVDIGHAGDILRQVGREVFADESLRPQLLDTPSVMGVESIEVDQIHVRVVARTLPGRQFLVGRALRGRIAAALRREGIHVPVELDTSEPTDMQS